MFGAVTIKDIAKALGLSTSTVSRALNGSYEIGAETKKLVQEYAEKVHYRPNPIALSLKDQKSHSIGVVVAELANNFFSQAINGIESIAYSSDYHVIITQTHESHEREIANVEHLMSRHVDGLLVSVASGSTDLKHFQSLRDRGFPIVFFDRVVDDIEAHKVVTNNFKGAFDATELLINNGFKRIAHIAMASNLAISRERLNGYKAALEKHGLPFDAEYVKHCLHGGRAINEVEEAIAELMALAEKPDAVFSGSDRITIGCFGTFKKMGLTVPNDVAMVGFTDSDVTELFDPPLTVIRQPAFQIGQMATEMLIKQIRSKYPVTEFVTETLSTELIERGSAKNTAKP
ncbi:LacI family DNA-binding transcriptional regulator [Mucilaginibacter myungsuensis]|uniref:LacI family DNA-binding transcriptional regulator n=1 Tax=Mucilaginibacter myungsuensis TaxID=649104 RepID=A0A929KV85_9SPHI|nr:LacI family DNA-binding transcriptional regulator [Mucilaginibacter myungsuensis]MBE9660518.1 LacI family DNA-binding transcriptional regulator [Mucilaginibacter myungsuensis]MDN3600562.1 LacI family DNA-binding transcriptional regulator [Mucilaginibacter myungsuensis]